MNIANPIKPFVLVCMFISVANVYGKNMGSNELPAGVYAQLTSSVQLYQTYKDQQHLKGNPNVVTMGSDPNCDVDINIANIQQVIDNGADEIRLADTASYAEDLYIGNRSLIIRGGFQDCQDANNDIQQNSKTLITGTGTAAVISISGANETHEIILQNLDIRNGAGSDFFYGGGISTLGADANITLDNVNVSNNQGVSGGGIAINAGVTHLTLIDTLVQNNEASTGGGGIHCLGSEASLSMFGTSGILNNHSMGDIGQGVGGGGLHLTQGCSASIFSGSSTNTSQTGISGNVSESDGGGAYVDEGAQLHLYGQAFCILNTCYGDSSSPVNVTGNTSKDNTAFDTYGNGGGVFINGANSQLFMRGVLINENSAEQKGGGIFVSLAQLNLGRSASLCWDPIRCNFFQANKAEATDGVDTEGGAMYLFNLPETVISHVFIEDNRADHGVAMAIRAGYVGLTSSVINNNGNEGLGGIDDLSVISLSNETTFTLEHVTTADNRTVNGIIERLDSQTSFLNIFASLLFDEQAGDLFSGPTNSLELDADCVISHDIAMLNTFLGTNVLDANPQFKNPSDRDYHLNAVSSPAVDFCVQHNSLGDFQDMDGQLKGWDDGSVINNQNNPAFTFDAGADETYDNDIIFANQYE